MIYSQSSHNQNDSFYQQNNQDPYYDSNPDLIPIKNCKFLLININLILSWLSSCWVQVCNGDSYQLNWGLNNKQLNIRKLDTKILH